MAVDTTHGGHVEDPLAQNFSVRDDHREIRFVLLEACEGLFFGHSVWLKDGNASLDCELFDRRRLDLAPSPLWFIGLCVHTDNFVLAVDKRL